jgi:hypothetical protein
VRWPGTTTQPTWRTASPVKTSARSCRMQVGYPTTSRRLSLDAGLPKRAARGFCSHEEPPSFEARRRRPGRRARGAVPRPRRRARQRHAAVVEDLVDVVPRRRQRLHDDGGRVRVQRGRGDHVVDGRRLLRRLVRRVRRGPRHGEEGEHPLHARERRPRHADLRDRRDVPRHLPGRHQRRDLRRLGAEARRDRREGLRLQRRQESVHVQSVLQ